MAQSRLTGSAGSRLLRIMRTIVEADSSLSLPEIMATVELPKPTVHRLVALLEDEGYVIKDAADRRYVPGPLLRNWGLLLMQSRVGRASRHAVLERVARSVEEACNMVVLDGSHITYIDRVDTAWPLHLRFDIGSHVPLHCTATGKLLLALQPKRVRERLLHHLTLKAMTPYSITDPGTLRDALERIRRERVGTDDQEFISEMVAVSLPIPPPSGAPIAAISIHAPVARRSLAELRDCVPVLQEAVDELSSLLHEPE